MSLRLATLLFGLLPAMASCEEHSSYRYRLTVVVDTPDGPRQGSTIIEVHTGTQSIPVRSLTRRATGEAAVVDLGHRGLLFALPRGETDLDWADSVYAYLMPPPPPGSSVADVADYQVKTATSMKSPIRLPRYFNTPDERRKLSGYPLLVRFRDATNYRTLERVDPDNLADAFGVGVKLRMITVQITRDDPERRVIRYLPWLADIKGYFDENSQIIRRPDGTLKYQPNEFRNNLSSKDFDPEV